MKFIKVVKALRMTVGNKNNRLKFAKDRLEKDREFWSSVIFSNEKRFYSNVSDGNEQYWADARLERKYFST